MSFSLRGVSPICRRRTCFQRLPRARYYASSSAAPAKPAPNSAEEKFEEEERKRRAKDRELQSLYRRMELATRKEPPWADATQQAGAFPILNIRQPVSWRSLKNVSWRGRLRWLRDLIVDGPANLLTILTMAREQRLPFLPWEQQPAKFWQKYIAVFAPRRSRDAWLSGLTKHALDMYVRVNEAVAKRNVVVIRELCQNEYQDEAIRRQKAYPPEAVMDWKFHGEVSPTRVLSIREAVTPMGKGGTDVYFVDALVRFDTTQSLTVKMPTKQNGRKIMATLVDSPPKRVTEYIVLEGWVNAKSENWRLRAQMYDDAEPYLHDPPKKKTD